MRFAEVALVATRACPTPKPSFARERPGEVRRSCLEIGRARRELKWEPTAELREGLSSVLAGLSSAV